MALYAFLSPLVLSRALDPQSYSAYLLGLQAVPFLLLLATPVQAAIAPKFARLGMVRNSSPAEVSSLLALAARLFFCIALIAFSTAFALSFILPIVLVWDTSFASVGIQAVRYLGIATALSIPAFIITSYAAGRHNFLWDNVLKCLGPYLGLILIFTAWQLAPSSEGILSGQLVVALSAFSTIFASFLVIYLGTRQLLAFKVMQLDANPHGMRDLIKESSGTYWWQFCALMSVGTGSFITSRVDLDSVAAYALAVSTTMVITGISTAFSAPFTIQIAQSSLKTQLQRVDDFKKFHDRFVMLVSVATVVLLVAPQSVFNLWLGESLGEAVRDLLIPLALANLLRQVTSPYTAAVLGLGQQGKIWLSPAIEAVVFICMSTLLGYTYGVQGVAYGLLIAALVRLIITLFYDLRITRDLLPLSAASLIVPRFIMPNRHIKP